MEVLIGECPSSGLTRYLTAITKEVIKDKYDLKVRSCFYGEEIIEHAWNSGVDIFILVLNNIRFRPVLPVHERLESSLKLISQIKTTYRKPVIALCPKDYSIAVRIADFFFSMPFDRDAFMEAIEKCLDMLPVLDVMQKADSRS